MVYRRLGGVKVKSTKKQQDNINQLLKLIKENPELKIVPMVDLEIRGDDYAYYMGEWGTAEIDEYHCADGRIYFKKHDFDELIDKWIDDNYERYPKSPDELLEERAIAEIDTIEWTKAIIVRINSI